MLLVFLGVSWFLGIWLGSITVTSTLFGTGINRPTWLLISGIGLLGGVLLRRMEGWRIGLLCVTAVALGAIRYDIAQPVIDETHIATYNESRNITLTGLVIDEPDVRDRFVNLRLEADQIILANGTTQPVTGLVLVRTLRFPVIAYGTKIEVNGRLETPPENEDFSYKNYLARQGIHSLIAPSNITVLAEGVGNPVYHVIFAFKQRAKTTIQHLIPDPQAALLTGILLGDDNGLPPSLAEAFRATGMTHIIAISGFNIAILIAILVGVSEPFLNKRGAVIFAVIGISLYTLLVGADASVVRAAVMGGIYLYTSRWLGRPNFAFASLFLAGIVMTLLNPFTLWDVGFQLSFAATSSLMLYADPLTQWGRRYLERWIEQDLLERMMGVLSEAIFITMAAQILTLPLMVAYFGQLSLISLLANALILPLQPGVMLWGGIAILTGLIIPMLGQIFGWVAWLFLALTTGLVQMLASVPWAVIGMSLSPVGVVGIYGLITAVTWFTRQSEQSRGNILGKLKNNLTQRLAFSGSLLALLLISSWGFTRPDGLLHIVFLDVGQGDATFIQTPSGRQILVDGGFYPSVLNAHLGQQMPFGDNEIDLLVATHPDADHVSGLVEVFERYRVNQLFTDGEGIGESPIYDEVLLAAEAENTEIHSAKVGEVVEIGDGVRLEIMHPGDALDTESRNENSVSIRLVYDNFTFLLTGDAEERAEKAMLGRDLPLQALVFKAGHHGSRSSSSAGFLQVVQPQIIVVSAGKENRFGHPHPEMLQRAADIGATVLRTDELGTIEVISNGQKMWWQAGPKNNANR